MIHLLHSTATVPAKAYHSFDQRYNHTWEVSKTGDGLIQVRDRSSSHSPRSPSPGAGSLPSSALPLDRTLVEKLINSYFTSIAPLIPVLTQSEFLALSDPQPPPILLYSVCLVAAAQRDVPENVFESLRTAVNELIKSEDVLCTASVVNVQSLLVLGVCADCHSRFVPSALSSLWIRLGTAIRMVSFSFFFSPFGREPLTVCVVRRKTWVCTERRLSSRILRCGDVSGVHVSSPIAGGSMLHLQETFTDY